MLVTLTLMGHMPSKKNTWSRKRNGGMFLPKEVSRAIDSLRIQAQAQWGGRPAVVHPNMTVRFYVKDQRRDRDGMLATLLDIFQPSILKNDNIANFNGRLQIDPAVIDADERTVIVLAAG